MKKLLFLTTIILCLGASPLWAVRKAIGNQQSEFLEMDDKEPCTGKTYSDLLRHKCNSAQGLILAKINNNYFDAHSINNLYGNYPFTSSYQVESQLDPITTSPIHNIDYYILHNQDEQTLEYLCSHRDIITGESEKATLYRDILYMNTITSSRKVAENVLRVEKNMDDIKNISSHLASSIMLTLATIYTKGVCGIGKDDAKAIEYLKSPIHENTHPDIKAHASLHLGYLYSEDKGDNKHYQKALDYFKPLTQLQYPLIRTNACLNTGIIYFHGDFGVNKDYQEALKHLIPVADQNDDLNKKTKANDIIGIIYFDGGHGINQNYKEALNYLTPAADQNDDLNRKIKASYYIGTIYFNGAPEVPQNYQEALNYLIPVANQSNDLNRKIKASYCIGEIHFNGGHGIDQNYEEAQKYFTSVASQTNHPLAYTAQRHLNTIKNALQTIARSREFTAISGGEIKIVKKQKINILDNDENVADVYSEDES